MIKAVIYANEDDLARLRAQGIDVQHTADDAIIPAAFPHSQVIDEIKTYFRETVNNDSDYVKMLRKSENLQRKLFDDTIAELEGALDYDGSLNWDDVSEIIHNSYASHEENFIRKHSAAR